MREILDNFIVFEGLDGAGTTTQREAVTKMLLGQNRQVWSTAEPTDGAVGTFIREVLSGQKKVHPDTLARLMAADRAEHIHQIKAHLAQGEIVLCDRYILSSLAYQGVEVPLGDVERYNSGFPLPSTLIYLDLEVSDCISRIDKRGDKKEIFEKSGFLLKVRDNYEKAVRNLDDRVKVIRVDGSLSREEISSRIKEKLIG